MYRMTKPKSNEPKLLADGDEAEDTTMKKLFREILELSL
jgi:hypothetical protein